MAALVAAAAIGLAATATFRSQSTRRVAHIGAVLEQVAYADQAIKEVSNPFALNAFFAVPAHRDGVRDALRAGTRERGVVTAADRPVEAPAPETAAAAAAAGFAVSPVRIRLREYYPGTSRGRLRFAVTIESDRAGGPPRRVYAQEFEVRAFEPGEPGALAFEIAEAPRWKVYP